MNQLLQELSLFNSETDKGDLEEWAQQVQAEIDRMNEKEGAFYYLILSEFYAVHLRDIETGYELLKRINIRIAVITDQIKVRRCFYKYLEGAYEFAIEELNEIIDISKSLSSRKIAVDFFRRIFQRDKNSSHSKLKSKLKKKESYEQDFLKALKCERSKSFKLARETHRAIFTKYGTLDDAILYESAKNIIRLMQKQGSKIERDQYQEYQTIIKNFQKTLSNKNYNEMKLQFLFIVLDFIDPDREEEEILIDYQLAKKCIVESLERAIKANKDKRILATLKETLRSLEEDEKQGEQICYKFLGDKGYNKLLMHERNDNSKSKLGRSHLKNNKSNKEEDKEGQEIVEEEEKILKSVSKSKIAKDKLKRTQSKLVNKKEEQFEGSNMIKINYNSGGYQQRYFYIKEDFDTSMKLYYCQKKGKTSASDDHYSLKGLKSVILGKQSQALKRKQCQQFPQDNCLTLKVVSEDKYQRNFYIKEKEDYDNWVSIFQGVIDSIKANQSKLKKTRIVIS